MGATDTDILGFLEHHGVRGQKWGIRHTPQRGSDQIPKQASIKVDETPWSNYKKSDYTPEQWHAACLIHDHSGAPTSKDQCKLPVKNPSGVVNRHGVYSAAASLAGARGGVQASASQKNSASNALRRLYSQMGVKAPTSLYLRHDEVDEFLEHYGVRGMKWGIRHPDVRKGRVRPVSTDFKKMADLRSRPVSSLSNKQLKALNDRLNMEQNLSRLNPSKVSKGRDRLKRLKETGELVVGLYALSQTTPGRHLIDLGKRAIGKGGPRQLRLFK